MDKKNLEPIVKNIDQDFPLTFYEELSIKGYTEMMRQIDNYFEDGMDNETKINFELRKEFDTTLEFFFDHIKFLRYKGKWEPYDIHRYVNVIQLYTGNGIKYTKDSLISKAKSYIFRLFGYKSK